MPRILHTADWQIGRLYGSFDPDDAVPLAEARFAAVERLAALAAREQVDAVVVAGDVFDAQTVSARSIRRLFNALEGYPGPWVMIPGNHDAALAESVWTHAARLGALPPNLHLALEPRVVQLPEPRLALLCAPLTQRHTFGDLTEWFDDATTPPSWLRVGVAHGAVQGVLAEDIDSANPIAADRAQRARLDYLALGDWHGTKRIDERTWYGGTPEPDRFKANDAGQALLVTLTQPGDLPVVQPIRTAQFRWRQQVHELRVASDVQTLVDSLGRAEAHDVLDLILAGQVDLADHIRLQQALGAAEARVRCLRRDVSGLRLAPTADDIAALHADGYVGEVIQELRDQSLGAGSADDPIARCSQDALAILTGLLAERSARGAVA
jgi:DNA repair exonuclease SbcCD nuclease subunit